MATPIESVTEGPVGALGFGIANSLIFTLEPSQEF
jgi:hypothetical protein